MLIKEQLKYRLLQLEKYGTCMYYTYDVLCSDERPYVDGTTAVAYSDR